MIHKLVIHSKAIETTMYQYKISFLSFEHSKLDGKYSLVLAMHACMRAGLWGYNFLGMEGQC